MTILKILWGITQSVFITILVLYILYGIDWIEHKMFEKDMTEYLERKHHKESLERYDYDLHLQYMMREWNW